MDFYTETDDFYTKIDGFILNMMNSAAEHCLFIIPVRQRRRMHRRQQRYRRLHLRLPARV